MTAKASAKYRETHPEYVERNRELTKIRRETLVLLARLHRREFEMIYRLKCKKYNVLPPVDIQI